jgi:uncharacterized protein
VLNQNGLPSNCPPARNFLLVARPGARPLAGLPGVLQEIAQFEAAATRAGILHRSGGICRLFGAAMLGRDHRTSAAARPGRRHSDMDSMTDRDGVGKPYGLVLLCLSTVGIIGLAFLIVALAGLAAALIDAMLFGWRPTIERIIEVREAAGAENSVLGARAILVLSMVIYGAIIVAVLAFAHWRGGQAWRDLVAWRPLRIAISDRWVLTIIVAAMLYGFAAQLLVGQIDTKSHLSVRIPADATTSLIFVILAIVVAPVTEELLFRGWIYTSLRHRFGLWTALVATSVVFALAHYDDTHLYALAVFPVGLALGGLRERTGSIKASILLHAFYNLAAVAVSLVD